MQYNFQQYTVGWNLTVLAKCTYSFLRARDWLKKIPVMRDLIEKIQPDVWLKMCEKFSGTSKGNEHFNYHNFLNISTLI